LRSVSKDQFGKAIVIHADSMQRFFNSRANKFNDVFPGLLSASKLNFHRLFRKTYGIIYIRNSDVFTDFFQDLERYYNEGRLDLGDALDHFFTSLYQRMFTVFNAQYKFDSRYLTCVSQTMRSLQPFGDVPEKLSQQLKQSFVATRTFNQALISGKKILNKIVKIQPKERCVIALTKMSSCPACEGFTEIKPCGDYCADVMKGCLAPHAEFGHAWDKYLDNLRELADRLKGPFDIEEVVDPIGVKISDAIMNFQRSGYEVSERVKQECGTPRIQKREAKDEWRVGVGADRGRSGKKRSKKNGQKVSKLKQLIGDIKDTVPAYKGFFQRLPSAICTKANEGQRSSEQQQCWNGDLAVSRPHDQRPKSDQATGKQSSTHFDANVYDQMQVLKAVNKRLSKAIKGQRVEWAASVDKGREAAGGKVANDKAKDYTGVDDYGSGADGCVDSDDEDCFGSEEGSGSGDDVTDPETVPEKTEKDRKQKNGRKPEETGTPSSPMWEHDHPDDPDIPALPVPEFPKDINSLEGGTSTEEDEYADNWPPWVTASSDDQEIRVIDSNDIYRQTPRTSGAAPSRLLSVAYFAVPIVTCALGSLFT